MDTLTALRSRERFSVCVAACVFGITCLSAQQTLPWPNIVGHKTSSLFDLWSIQHFLSGCAFGMAMTSNGKPVTWWRALAVAMLWESIEYSGEAGFFGHTVAHWFGGVEHWANRLFADPTLFVLGSFVGAQWSQFRKAVTIALLTWLIANLLCPDTMYIQGQLARFFRGS